MNRKLLSLATIFCLGGAFAQPTLTSADEATVGTNLTYYVGDSTNFDMKESVSGANVTWDWSGVGANTTTPTRTGNVNDASTDIIFQPLGATHNFEIQDYLNMYYNFDSNVKHSQGFRYSTDGSELAVVEFDSASYNLMEYPFNYTDAIANTISGSTTLNLQGSPMTASSTSGVGSIDYDAHGTLVLHDTTFYNVARVFQRDSVHASFGGVIGDIDFVISKYDYYDPTNLETPVFIASRVDVYTGALLPQFPPIVSVYSIVPFNPTASVNDLNEVETTMEVYPNPATNNFTLKFDSKSTKIKELQIVDVTGKIVNSITTGFKDGLNTLNINTSNLAEGIYYTKLISNNGVISKKVVIQ